MSGRKQSDPRCYWCHCETDLDTGYRGTGHDLDLPLGVGVVVCTPACPERPTGARVWRAGWRLQEVDA